MGCVGAQGGETLTGVELLPLLDRCEHAVAGTVLAADSYWTQDHRQILTDIQILVSEDFKGNVDTPDGILTLTELGGTVGEDALLVSHTPRFNVGEEVLVLTEYTPDGRLIVLGRDQAKTTLRPALGVDMDAAGHRMKTDAAAEQGSITYCTPGADLVGQVRELMVERGFVPVHLGSAGPNSAPTEVLEELDPTEVALKQAYAEQCPANWDDGGMYAGRDPLDELVLRRDAFAKHFANADGTVTAVISQTPVHYQDADGAWKEIRTDICPNPDERIDGYPYAIGENAYRLVFGASLDEGYAISLVEGDLLLGLAGELRVLGDDGAVLAFTDRASSTGVVADNTMTFGGTYPGAGDRLVVRRRGVDHDIVLRERPAVLEEHADAQMVAFRELVVLPDGWRIEPAVEADCESCEPGSSAGLHVVDASGKPVAEFIAPVIREAQPRAISRSDAIKGAYTEYKVESVTGSYRLEQIEGGVYVETQVPASWLTAADRTYPVVVDPTVNVYPSEVAGWTGFSYNSSTCYCGDSYCGDNVRWRSVTVRKGWMYFNTASITDGSTITDTVIWYRVWENNCPYYYLRAMAGFSTLCSDMWTYETTGTIYKTHTSCPTNGWNSDDLGTTADSDLQARLGSDYFGVAFDEYETSDYYATAYGYYGSNDPYVVVTYTAGAQPGENCSNPQNLAGLTSPYSGTTAGYANDFTLTCGGGSAPDRIFYYDLPNYYTIEIWQSANNYDSVHETRRGPTCPGDTLIACTDDDDYTHHSWTNTTGTTQRVWFILDGYSSYSGTFTLNWTVTPINPCSYVTAIGGCGAGYTQTYSGTGSGVWSVTACGYSTPGVEKIYSFVAPSTGTYSIQVTTGGCWVDYFWQASSCSSSGWTCIDDINSAGTYGAMSWTGGTTYYLLLDAESTSSCTHQFYVNCPAAAPTITSVSPAHAPAGVGPALAGALVTIGGSNFGTKGANDFMCFWTSGSNYYYNDAWVVSWTDTQIQCYVPAGCSSKDCAIYKNGTWSNFYTFAVDWSFWYRWLDASVMPLGYYINQSGCADISGDAEFSAVRAGLQTWENVLNSYLDHSYLGTTALTATSNDGYNVISWTSSGWPHGSGVIGVSTIWLNSGVIIETDQEYNDAEFTFTTSGVVAGQVDILNVVTHESGHGFCGLSDLYGTPDAEKTMFGTLDVTNGEDKKRSLENDDVAGGEWIYPWAGPANNNCAAAAVIFALPAYVSGKNPLASDDYTGSTCDGPYKNIWWRVTGTGNEIVATTCSPNTTFDTEIAVYDGCGGAQVACNDDYSCSWNGLHSTVRWCSTLGQTYYISVGSYYSSSATGSLELYVEEGELTPGDPNGAGATPGTVCAGEPTLLSCNAPGAEVDWYSGSCGGTYVGTGNPLALYPTASATYHARARNAASGCTSSGCSNSVSVTVLSASSAPTGASAAPDSICAGQTTGLSVAGGALGAGASWFWYAGSCGGTQIGSGASINVSPDTTTTYFVRAEGDCNVTDCASVTVTVLPSPGAPSVAEVDRDWLCPDDGGDIMLTVQGGSGTTLNWYSGGCGGPYVGSGSPLYVASPASTTTYYARWENSCGASDCVAVTAHVDTTGPTFTQVPSAVVVYADAGDCVATDVALGQATAVDDHNGVTSVVATRSDSQPLSAPYPQGPTTITWTATDGCGNESQDSTQMVFVRDTNELVVDVELRGVSAGTWPRCLSFELIRDDCSAYQFDELVTFVGGTIGGHVVEVPCGSYACVLVQDELHTLTRRLDRGLGLDVVGKRYEASFTTANADLINGDLYDDNLVDIVDFGVYIAGWGLNPPDPNCATGPPHADINGDHAVDVTDFNFISAHFLSWGDEACCQAAGGAEPRTAISIAELLQLGVSNASRADLNHDGMLDLNDVQLFANGVTPDGPPDGGRQRSTLPAGGREPEHGSGG